MAPVLTITQALHFAEVKIGKAYSFTIECVDANGDPFDFGAATAVMQVRAKLGAPVVLLTPTAVLSTGSIAISWSGADTADLPTQDAIWGLDTVLGGESYPMFEGRFPLRPAVVQ